MRLWNKNILGTTTYEIGLHWPKSILKDVEKFDLLLVVCVILMQEMKQEFTYFYLFVMCVGGISIVHI